MLHAYLTASHPELWHAVNEMEQELVEVSVAEDLLITYA